jgi:hypothetical protein
MGWDCLPAIAIGAGAARLRRDERGVQAGAGHRHEPLRSHLLPQPRRRRLPVSLGLHHREVDFHSSVFTVRFCANMRVRLHISHERFFCFFWLFRSKTICQRSSEVFASESIQQCSLFGWNRLLLSLAVFFKSSLVPPVCDLEASHAQSAALTTPTALGLAVT